MGTNKPITLGEIVEDTKDNVNNKSGLQIISGHKLFFMPERYSKGGPFTIDFSTDESYEQSLSDYQRAISKERGTEEKYSLLDYHLLELAMFGYTENHPQSDNERIKSFLVPLISETKNPTHDSLFEDGVRRSIINSKIPSYGFVDANETLQTLNENGELWIGASRETYEGLKEFLDDYYSAIQSDQFSENIKKGKNELKQKIDELLYKSMDI